MYMCSTHNRRLYPAFKTMGKPEKKVAVFLCPVLGCKTIRANKWAKKNAKRRLHDDGIAPDRT